MVRALYLLPALCLLVGAVPCGAGEDLRDVDPKLAPLAHWLRQEDTVVRAMAAFELREHDLRGAVRLAVQVLEGETDEVAIGCALGSLTRRARADLVAEGGPVLAALLVRLIEHEHPILRDRAWQALRTLAGEDPTSTAADLRLWWLRSRKALAKEQAALLQARRRPKPSTAGGVPPAPGESITEPADRNEDIYRYVSLLRRDGLELCIVLDHTGSMGSVIGAARSRAASLVRRLAWLVPRFRAGLVTYDDAARLRLPLTVDGDALRDTFRKISAGGGGDWEEGVDKGIALALSQKKLGWSKNARRVIVVIGDAPPHAGDVGPLLRRITKARASSLYVHPVIVSTVSTYAGGVDRFGAIATAGGGIHVTLATAKRLEAELVALTFGAGFRDRVEPWLAEVDLLRRSD